MKSVYETLEMNKIQEQVQSYCASTLGKQKIQDLAISDDCEDLQIDFLHVDEAMKLIGYQGRIPLGGLSDISFLLEKAKRDGTLQGEELYKIVSHLECVKNVKNYIDNSEMTLTYMKEKSDGLIYQDHLLNEIKRCILPNGEVSDHASELLFSLRKKIQDIKSQIHLRMESFVKEKKDILSIDQMTTRNDHFVLPVKSGYKNQIHGLIHSQSATGQTVYIEPESVMIMNNQLNDIRASELEEVHRILYSLSQMIKNNYIHFYFNLEILKDIDFIFAKAQYGYDHHCCIPHFESENTSLILKEARHPFIDEKKVVSNHIILDKHRMLLISGSNTGGKTVTLKTAGLLSFMALCGLPIPCLEAHIPLFDQIYVDLGDEQSIEQSLSTFSSHMMKIKDILEQSTSKSLIILDEIGSGTDPQEGESLAEAILMEFLNIGAMVLTSTHFGKLKTFAKEHPQILLASVSFDVDNMKPTYHLKMDSAGQSYAIEIAQLLGIPHDIIDRAQKIKQDSMGEHEKLLEMLEKKEEQLLLREEELETLLLQNQKLNKQYEHHIHQLEKKQDDIIQKAKDEANQLIVEAKENIDLIVETMKTSTLKDHEFIQAKHDLDKMLFIDEEVKVRQQHTLAVGDHVKVIKMNREGDIVEILKNHMIMVSLSGLNIKLHEDDVEFLHSYTKIKNQKKSSSKKVSIKKNGSYEINIIGKRYEQAMAEVDKFLDDALVLGYPHVRIVHGMGTGALRKGVHQLLNKNKNIVSYRSGGPNEGGLGATLAYFE